MKKSSKPNEQINKSNDGGMLKRHGSQWSKLAQFEQKINKVILDYNSKYKINIH